MSNNGKRVAWVTGGGSGIGESGAEFLAADGWIVVISGRRKEELERVVASITKKGGTAEAIQLDVSNKADVNKAADQILARHGRIDLLVNSAGIVGPNSSWSDSSANWKNASALPSARPKNVWQYTRSAPNSSSASDHVATSGRPIRSS